MILEPSYLHATRICYLFQYNVPFQILFMNANSEKKKLRDPQHLLLCKKKKIVMCRDLTIQMTAKYLKFFLCKIASSRISRARKFSHCFFFFCFSILRFRVPVDTCKAYNSETLSKSK